MKKNKSIEPYGFTLKFGHYPHELYISFGESFDEVNNIIHKTDPDFDANKELNDVTIQGKINGRMLKFSSGKTMIYLTHVPSTDNPRDMGILIHELQHALSYHFRDLKTPLSDDTEEVYAYMMQFLLVEIIAEINRHL